MVGTKIKNPSNIIKNVASDITLIFEILLVFQKIKAVNGDKNKIIEGDPNNPWSLCGNENIPAPNIENEKVQRIKIGILFNPLFLQILNSPMLKTMLKIDVKTSPNVNIFWVAVPISPNSLTILVAWLYPGIKNPLIKVVVQNVIGIKNPDLISHWFFIRLNLTTEL